MGYPTRPSNVRVYQFRQPPGCSRMILPVGSLVRQRQQAVTVDQLRDVAATPMAWPPSLSQRDEWPTPAGCLEYTSRPVTTKSSAEVEDGTRCKIRTRNLLIRSQALYPLS